MSSTPGAGWLWAALVLYGAAGLLYLGFLVRLRGPAQERLSSLARVAFVIAFVAHTCEIGARGFARLHPASSAGEAVGFLAWLVAGAFLAADLRGRWRLHAVGAFVAPAAIVLLLGARLAPASGATAEGLGVLGRVHISLATAGVSLFALAAALAAVYLALERQLKHKHMGVFVRRGPALETLDHLVHRCVQLGFPLFTVAMVTGAFWSARRADAVRPEYTIAGVAWVAFALLLVARVTAGWRGRRAALMAIFGFSAALLVVGFYLVRGATGA